MNPCPPPPSCWDNNSTAVFNLALFNDAVFGGKPPKDHAIVQVGHGLIYPALRKANITIGPQRIPSEAQFQDAIEELNRLIGTLNCDPLSIYSLDIQTFPLQKGKKTYTIGQDPQGCQIADFDVPRPQGIAYANTILTSSGTPLRFPLQLYTDQQWANVGLQDIGTSIPWALYNNWSYPISTLYLYGQPIADMQLELYMWHTIPTFTSLCDVVVLPPGYEDVLVLNLACRLAPHFQRVVSPDVTAQARESLMRLLSYNAPQPIAVVNGLCRGGDTTFTMIAGAGGRPGGVGLNDPTQTLGDLLVRGSSDVNRLPIGNAGEVLTVDPASWSGMRWAVQATAAVQSVFGRTGDIVAQAGDYTVDMITGAMADPLIARGDLLVRGPAETTRIPAGADNQVLIADSSSLLGVRWATIPTSAVSSVFGRTGAVIAAAGDYTAAQITNAVDATQVYNDPPWINSLSFFKLTNVPAMVSPTRSIFAGTGLTGGGDLTQDRTLSVVSDSTVQRIQVSQNGTLAGTRPSINFIPGANTTIAAADNAGANRVDVTVTATGGGSGGGVSTWNTRTGAVFPAIGDYSAAQVTNAVDTTQSYANPAWITSLAWGKIAGVPTLVNSFNGRTGSVTPQASDYAASQIANAVDTTQSYSNPSWISSLAWSKITGAPAIVGQTPWLSDIDGNSHMLRSVTAIAIGSNVVPAAAAPLDVAGNIRMSGVRSTIFYRGDGDTHTGGLQITGFGAANPPVAVVVTPTDNAGTPIDGAIDLGGLGLWNQNVIDLRVSGNVSIGTRSNQGKLSIFDSTASHITLQYGGQALWWLAVANTPGRLRIGGQGASLPANYAIDIDVNGPVGIQTAGVLQLQDPFTVSGFTAMANLDAAIRLQSSGTQWIHRIAAKSTSGGVPRMAFDVQGPSLGIAVERLAIGQFGGITMHCHTSDDSQPWNGSLRFFYDAPNNRILWILQDPAGTNRFFDMVLR